MVADSHAVVQPGAVVVVPFDTAVADRAMAGPWGAEDVAVGAQLAGVDFLEEFEEVEVLLYVSRVRAIG